MCLLINLNKYGKKKNFPLIGIWFIVWKQNSDRRGASHIIMTEIIARTEIFCGAVCKICSFVILKRDNALELTSRILVIFC